MNNTYALANDDALALREQAPRVRAVFMVRPIRNDEASARAGHAVYDDVEYVEWHPIGAAGIVNADRVDRVRRTRPDLWLRAGLGRQYEAWRAGREEPEEGLPLKMWPPLADHPGLLRVMLESGVRTVEQLAVVPEADAARLGMGGRTMRDKARDWLVAANDMGRVTQELHDLRARLRERDMAVDELRAHVQELLAAQAAAPTAGDRAARRGVKAARGDEGGEAENGVCS